LYDTVVANDITQSMTINNPVGAAYDTAPLLLRIRGDGTPRALTWGSMYYQGGGSPLPTTTTGFKTMHLGFRFNSRYNMWFLLASAQEP
jgi:hypothetical protein